MGYHENGLAFLIHFIEHGKKIGRRTGVQRSGWFVRKDQPGICLLYTSTHLLKLLSSKTKCYCNKRIIASGRTNRIQLILNSLPSLVIIPADFVKGILDRTFLAAAPALIGV